MAAEQKQFDHIVEGLTTKSDKIRALGRQGVLTSDIARYLGIRYQHARNVLVDGGLLTTKRQDANNVSEAFAKMEKKQIDAKPFWIEVDAQGQVQLPANLREAVGINGGSRVHVRVNGDAIEILSQRAALNRAHSIVRKFVPPGDSLVDELIADRRREAEKEEEV